jgi:deoxyribodipyrimidine photo-lyase
LEIPELKLPNISELGFDAMAIDERSVLKFRGGESEGLKRLEYYFEETGLVSSYKQTRNQMIGGDYSSKFSPWLAMGCLSARTICHELKAYEQVHGSNESTYWLVFELLWRDYFRLMMIKYPKAFFLKKGLNRFSMSLPTHKKEVFEDWMNGKTGNDFIDANMIELKKTGFMSNRGRQNVASFLCHHLQSDWQYGAAYFEEMLIDYDVSSNWCNWAYLAGVGNDPIKNRVFNPDKQAQQYDGDRKYRNLWL